MVDKTYGRWNLEYYTSRSGNDTASPNELDDIAYSLYLLYFKNSYKEELLCCFDQKTFNFYYNNNYYLNRGANESLYYITANKQLKNKIRKNKLEKIKQK